MKTTDTQTMLKARYDSLLALDADEVVIIAYKVLREYGTTIDAKDRVTLRAALQALLTKADS